LGWNGASWRVHFLRLCSSSMVAHYLLILTCTHCQGSAIAEDRTLREKYYEIKLQANFLKVSPAFLTTRPQNIGATAGAYTDNSALKTTFTFDVVGNKTGFFVVRYSPLSFIIPRNTNVIISSSQASRCVVICRSDVQAHRTHKCWDTDASGARRLAYTHRQGFEDSRR
jgi:hypothetical protein